MGWCKLTLVFMGWLPEGKCLGRIILLTECRQLGVHSQLSLRRDPMMTPVTWAKHCCATSNTWGLFMDFSWELTGIHGDLCRNWLFYQKKLQVELCLVVKQLVWKIGTSTGIIITESMEHNKQRHVSNHKPSIDHVLVCVCMIISSNPNMTIHQPGNILPYWEGYPDSNHHSD